MKEIIFTIVLFCISFFGSIGLYYLLGKPMDVFQMIGAFIVSILILLPEIMIFSAIIPDKYQTTIKEKEDYGTKV